MYHYRRGAVTEKSRFKKDPRTMQKTKNKNKKNKKVFTLSQVKRCPSYFRRNFFFKRKTSIFDVRALKSRKLDLYTNRSTKENEEDRNRNTESEAKKIERHRQ